MWGAEDPTKNGEDSSEEEDDDDEEEDSDDEDAAAAAAKEEASREARKAQKKARKEAAIAKAKGKAVEVGDMPTSDEEEEDDDDDDDMPANPNHSKAARNQAKAPSAAAAADADADADVDEVTDGVKKLQAGNRKEREALEAAAAKERYLKMQAQGKTDEAKADLARLKVIREQRAAEAARRQVSRTPQHPFSPQACAILET